MSCPEPSCCLQDSPAGVFGLASAVAGDFVPPVQGDPGDISSSSSGARGATSADFLNRLVDKPDQKRVFADDNHAGVVAGMRPRRKLSVGDGI